MKNPHIKYQSKKETKEDLTKKIEEPPSKKEKIFSKENKKLIVEEKKEKPKIIIEIPNITPEKIAKFSTQHEFSEDNWGTNSPSKKVEIIPLKNLENSVITTPVKRKKDLEEEKDKYSPKKEAKDEPKYFSSSNLNKVEYVRSSEISKIESNPWNNQTQLKKRNIGLMESAETKLGVNPQQERYTPASVFEKENLQKQDFLKKKEIKYRPSAIS